MSGGTTRWTPPLSLSHSLCTVLLAWHYGTYHRVQHRPDRLLQVVWDASVPCIDHRGDLWGWFLKLELVIGLTVQRSHRLLGQLDRTLQLALCRRQRASFVVVLL